MQTSVAGTNLRATLLLFDTYGNPVDFGPVPMVAATVGLRGAASVDVTLSNAADGSYIYAGTVRVLVAGSYIVSASFGGAGLMAVAPKRLTVIAGAAAAAASTIEGRASRSFSFQLQVCPEPLDLSRVTPQYTLS